MQSAKSVRFIRSVPVMLVRVPIHAPTKERKSRLIFGATHNARSTHLREELEDAATGFQRPHAELASCVNCALTRPRNVAWLFVSLFIAVRPMLKPEPAWSIASTLMLVPLNVSCQQVPQFAELNPSTADAPPMLGKSGSEPKVVKPVP